jgi:uncharacterized alpha-E superfamily protein
MLSRVANSLYWMSRYIERADNTSRIVDVNLQLLLDHRSMNSQQFSAHWLPIIEATGDPSAFWKLKDVATAETVTDYLVFEPKNTNSLLSSISQARENARMVRDQLTVDIWEELNRLYLYLHSQKAREDWETSPFDFLHQVKSSSLTLQGLTDATIPHNEGWLFLQAGKFLERADMTSRILDVRHGLLPERGVPSTVSQVDALAWASVLHSCSAWDAYKSIHGAEVHPRLVAEFLMLSDNFPRSVKFCVERLNRSLRRISGVADGRFCNDSEKLAGRLVAQLQFGTIDEVFQLLGLHQYIDALQIQLIDIGNALFNAYIFQPFQNLEAEILVQQEEQQQQSLAPSQAA